MPSLLHETYANDNAKPTGVDACHMQAGPPGAC